jgi:signal transduction histidine kinase
MDEQRELSALRQENRILKKKLERSQENLRHLEAYKARSDRLHRRLLAEARESAERLSHSEQAAKKASQAKSAFLATMSHELRTPLNAIIAYSDLLLEEPSITEEDVQEDLREIQRAGHHLLRLIESILSFSRIEAGHIELSEESAALSSLLSDAGQLIEPLVREGNSQLIIQTEQPDVVVQIDRLRLRQVLLNLLGNAIKFTPNGTIRLSAWAEHEWVFFSVEDTGAGMSPEVCARIFEAFYQEPTSGPGGGVGLGLSVSAQLCERMGGRIEVDSQPGRGSRFTVTLPRQRQEQLASR